MKNSHRGFTLIEVLVALVIIAYVGISAQQRVGQFLDDRAHLTDRQQAHWVAWNETMKTYQQTVWGLAVGDQKPEKSGRVTQLGRTWYFQRDQQDTLSRELYRLEVQVKDTPFKMSLSTTPQPNTSALVMYLVN